MKDTKNVMGGDSRSTSEKTKTEHLIKLKENLPHRANVQKTLALKDGESRRDLVFPRFREIEVGRKKKPGSSSLKVSPKGGEDLSDLGKE